MVYSEIELKALPIFCDNNGIWIYILKYADNNIGVEGASKISEVLRKNTTLTTLDLGSMME